MIVCYCMRRATDEDAVLTVICAHLARVEVLLLAAISQLARLRLQQPVLVWQY